MKTLEIPNAIFRRAKFAAAERGIPVREFVIDAVKEKIESHQKAAAKPWVTLAGSLEHLHDETQRINRIIEKEFERIEPEDWLGRSRVRIGTKKTRERLSRALES